MTFAPYLATLRTLTAKQLEDEVAARLAEFNRVEEQRKPWSEIDEARQRHRLAVRELAKRRERK